MKKAFLSLLTYILVLTSFGQEVATQNDFEQLKADFLNPYSSRVLVASHRAMHHKYPENSIPAVQQAIEQGVDIIEIDVKVSEDGMAFLMHDRTIDRTTSGKGDPEKMSWKELQKLSLVHDGEVTPYKIPTLEEILLLSKGKILVDLDLKTSEIEKVMEIVEQTGTQDNVFFFDSDFEVLEKVQAANPDFMIMPRAYSLAMADSAIQLFSPEVVHIDFSFYDDKTVDLIKSHEARVWINALGDPDEAMQAGKAEEALEKLLEYGANIIQTDYPLEWMQHLSSEE
ncbi:glycerophosphoryl diester phosphodiesterase [Catalinimonas alkaloidigena]|uniref:glycerophosphodiester phosphodiesterase family protein n=1 Tax=Catalinimonas alkaloidigena TaxID=1075417 RepID=UPI002405E05E|nr:glycerophosphodiester phosphodiesterase family protein [Catalinimonas alkaloidigena]MDF9800024.1 glycerophosphoryl diester phosphodiesterase [Catalinimonas alkaloidigena]